MRIVAWINKDSSPSFHRITAPLLLMEGVEVFITNNLLEEHFEKGCDIFLYNRVLPDHAIPKIAALKEKMGFKIVVDVDDFWYLDEHHVLYEYYNEIGFAGKQICQLIDADMVICTHERLAMEIKEYNDNVHVCPNAIPKAGQFDIKRKPYHLTRLFWQGSDTHKADVELLKAPMNALAKISKKIKMVMAGYAEDHDDWYEMVINYTAGTKHQYKLIPYTHIDKYYAAYGEADICLVPLVNSKFNRHKSNLKVLEAANLALPVIASAVHPYLDLPIDYCRNSGDWIRNITKLVSQKNKRKEKGLELQEYCDQHFNFNKINNERKQIFEYVASKQRVS